MAREILFRGKGVYTDKWVKGSFLDNPDKLHGLIKQYRHGSNAATHYGSLHHVRRETVGQFTGLLDKNGKRVFEGDIVRYEQKAAHFSRIGKVYFADETGLDWRLDILEPLSRWHGYGKTVEVLGNIHDNAELLK